VNCIHLRNRNSDTLLKNVVEDQLASSGTLPAGARFGQFSVDLSSGELLRSGVRVPIQGQPFHVLRLLLRAEGKTVTRDELRRALWPEDTFVDFELGVNTAVKKLRQALEDSAEHSKFIETLPKYGYRFMTPVEWVIDSNAESALPLVEPIAPPESAPAPAAPVPRPPAVTRHWMLTAALALATLTAVALLVGLADENRLGYRLRDAVPPLRISERRLTANPDDAPVTSSAISPDGKYLVFTDRTGFYVRQIDGGETHVVALPKGFDALAESWFPDSIHLIVSWVEDPKEPPSIWEISVMGGTPRKLAQEGVAARVSPDGSKIAFLSGKFERTEIWLMQGDGSDARQVVKAAEDADFSPVAWAPDGRGLAYVRTMYFSHSLETKIEFVDISSRQTEVVLSRPGLGAALSWTRRGRLIYSLQEPVPNKNDFNLWSVQLDPHTARPLGSGTRVTADHGLAAGLSVSEDGRLLAVRRWALQNDVYIAELLPGGRRMGTSRRMTLDERQDYPYSWTADSKAVFFASDRDGPSHIFKQSVDQTQPELVVGNDNSGIARLTPDGSALLYVVGPKESDSLGNVRIMRMPLVGGPSRFVLQAPMMWNHQCARLPSTLCIYSQTAQNQESFFSFDPMNGARKLLTTVKGGPFNWTLSPDGKYLATVKRGFQTDFGIVQTDPGVQILSIADGSKRTIPVPGWAGITNIDWSADGKSLWTGAFHTNHAQRFAALETFALLNVGLNGRVTVTLEKGNVSFYWAIASPDGRRLALAAATDSSNVLLLQL
jgi:Tol biopolymer transport system component/DNA-binding winged helix-turn-helix (wHTH) protein